MAEKTPPTKMPGAPRQQQEGHVNEGAGNIHTHVHARDDEEEGDTDEEGNAGAAAAAAEDYDDSSSDDLVLELDTSVFAAGAGSAGLHLSREKGPGGLGFVEEMYNPYTNNPLQSMLQTLGFTLLNMEQVCRGCACMEVNAYLLFEFMRASSLVHVLTFLIPFSLPPLFPMFPLST